jgi:TamB, inner membrane protein subunit of TAM complex
VKRRRVLSIVALLLLVALGMQRAPEGARRLIVSGLEAFFHRPASVEEVRLHLFPFHAEVLGLRVAGSRPGPPFLEVERVVAVPSLAPLWGRRVVLARLSIDRPVVRVNAWAAGGDDIPQLNTPGGGGLDFRVRRLEINHGELVLQHERIPLSADLPAFEARLSARRGGVLFGHVAFAPGRVRFGTLPEMALGTEFDVDAAGLQLTLAAGHVRGEGTDLAYSGQIQLTSPPEARLAMTGRLDLGMLDTHVLASGLDLDGAASYQGSLAVVAGELRAEGHVEGHDGRLLGLPVVHFGGEVERSDRGLRLREMTADVLGGRCRLDVDVAPAGGRVRVAGRLDDLDAEGLLRAVFGYGPLNLGAAVRGDIDLSWPRSRSREISGRMALGLAPANDPRTPLSGRVDWSAERGAQVFKRADLRTPYAGVQLRGRVGSDDRLDLELDADSPDLAAADEASRHLLKALGAQQRELLGVRGSGMWRGRLKGPPRDPLFEGRFSARDLEYRGVLWGEAEWAGSASADEVSSHSLVLRHNGAELWLDGRTETGALGGRDGLDVRVRFSGWPALDFVRALDWGLDVTGRISGEAEVAGRRSEPRGQVHVTAREGRLISVPFEDLEMQVLLRGDVTEATAARLRIGGGRVEFHGTLSGDIYDGAVGFRDVALDDAVPEVAPGVRFGGRLSGDVTLSGPLARPTLEGQVFSPRLFLGDEGIGALSATLSAEGDGNLALDARVRSPRVDLTASGSVGIAAPHTIASHVVVNDASVDPFLRLLAPALPAAAGIVMSGEFRIDGPLAEPQRLDAEALLSQILLVLPDYPVKNVEPLLVRLAAGRATFSELQLAGEGTSLNVNGSLGVSRDAPISFEARGDADLRALAAVTRRLRGRGAAWLTLSVGGTRAAPELDGRLDIEGAGVRVRGFPQGLDAIRGSVSFGATGAHFEDVHATLGGGGIDLSGRVAYDQGRLGSFEILGMGRGLTLRYPEGLRVKADAELRLFGDATTQWLTGSIDVAQAAWTRRYDFASELLATRRVGLTPASLGGALRFDVKIRAPGTLTLDNNLANLVARAELELQGTSDVPVLLGRAEVDRGRVYFLGNTYVIRRGTIDFTNPQQIDPLFDIEAESRVRSYRVSLKINGTLERIFPTLTSDPPLSAVQILNLLAGADESAVASLSQSQVDQTRLAASGAATLAAGRLSEEVGLERGAERLLGLNRFSIDPSVVRGGVTNPSARLTVGKRLTPDLNVLYSVDLRGTDERLLSIEYTISDKLSVLVTGAEPGGLGFDLRLRHSR